jgi:hypothetical protein
MWQGQSFWIPIVAILIGPLIIWISLRFQQAKIQAQRDVQLALLGKFSSGEEMTRFLATDEGKRLVDHLSSPPKEEDPREKTAGMLTGASVLTMLGIGLAIAGAVGGKQALLIPALITGAIGLGLFAGAAISHRFSKKMGLIRERS